VVTKSMDCFFHNAVPSVAPCRGCKKPLCATCRNENGDCPGCVLAARIDAARQANMINGGVGASYGTYSEPHQEQQTAYSAPPPQPEYEPAPAPPGPPRVQRVTALAVRPETRAVLGLSYVPAFWPLALIALLDSKSSHLVKRQAWQALGFNLGLFGFSAFLTSASAIPVIGFSVWPMLTLIVPIWLVASIVYAVRVWQGEDIDVPIVSDWVDARLPASPQGQS
jgi:uncharacterized membrane protein